MPAQLINGKQIAEQIQQETAAQVAAFTRESKITPCLAAVLMGENPASEVYVRNKRRACEKVGMTSQLFRLEANTSEAELLNLVTHLNRDPAVHGILVQLPLPKQIRETRVLDAV